MTLRSQAGSLVYAIPSKAPRLMTEDEIAEKWRALANREGHRAKAPDQTVAIANKAAGKKRQAGGQLTRVCHEVLTILRAGDRLNSVEMGARIGCGRSVIGEALRRLRAEGYVINAVKPTPNSSYYVIVESGQK